MYKCLVMFEFELLEMRIAVSLFLWAVVQESSTGTEDPGTRKLEKRVSSGSTTRVVREQRKRSFELVSGRKSFQSLHF